MRLLSWNVCGLAAAGRKGALAALLDLEPAVDVFAFQETRCDDAKAVALLAPMVARGYAHVALHASRVKAGHAGVAIVSRLPFKRLPDMPGDDQGRVLTVDLGGVTLVAAYVQNAGVKALERLPDRIAWDARFLAHVAAQGQPTVVCGDLNVARDELDVHHPERQGRHAGFTPQERAGFEALLAATGLVDTFRRARPGEAKYSYWSNFARSREKGLGWRIDYFLAPADLPCSDPDILDGVLGSDHAPVVLTVAAPMADLTDRKADLVAALAALKARSEMDKEVFKARAFGRVLEQLQQRAEPVLRLEDVEGLPGVGASIREAMAAVFEGRPSAADADPRLSALIELQTVTGVGPARALALVNDGVTGVADLQARAASGALKLNAKEALGLAHRDAFLRRIPRDEMDAHRAVLEAALAGVAPHATVTLMGSYRRGQASSGDVDAAIVAADAKAASAAMGALIDRLVADGYALKANFGRGPKKYLGVVRLPALSFRRLDLMAVPASEAPFALLYFTGSDRFNVRVRGVAKAAGFSLNEHRLTPETPEAAARLASTPPPPLASEDDVLRFLGLAPVPPSERAH